MLSSLRRKLLKLRNCPNTIQKYGNMEKESHAQHTCWDYPSYRGIGLRRKITLITSRVRSLRDFIFTLIFLPLAGMLPPGFN